MRIEPKEYFSKRMGASLFHYTFRPLSRTPFAFEGVHSNHKGGPRPCARIAGFARKKLRRSATSQAWSIVVTTKRKMTKAKRRRKRSTETTKKKKKRGIQPEAVGYRDRRGARPTSECGRLRSFGW